MRATDWSATALGPVATWPTSLRTMVGVVLASRFPMLLWWGPDLIQLYNDAYRPVLGDKHPRSLGAPGREVWAEIWDVLGPLAEGVYRGGPSTWNDDLLLPMNRRGFIEETYFSFSYSAVRDDDGSVGGVLVTCAENTERVQGERQLRMLRDLAAHSAAAKTAEEACRTAARILAGNDADLPFALLYLSDGETVRLVDGAGFAPGVTPPARWPFAEAAARGERIIDDLRARFGALPGGRWEVPPERAVVLPLLRSGAAGPYGFLVAGVSPRRALDERYLGLYRLTAEHIATAIANARAAEEQRQRAEALAAIDRAKTLFFSNVSHEFRTPLTLILGPLEEALGRGGALAGAELDIAHRNALRLLKLVNALLDFSRIEAGRTSARFAPTDLARLTGELAAVFRAAIERAGLTYVVGIARLAEPVYVDRDMWEQIVLNLLSNAVKFTFEGSIAITLRDAGRDVELVVRDSGVGVAAAELPRLFERFHRVEGTRARTHEGSGIGLALVHDLVTLHGGIITAESELGRGTTFRVRLPRGRAHLPAEQIVAGAPLSSSPVRGEAFVGEALRWLPGGAEPAVSPAARSDERVLVVDDNADMRDYLTRLLEPHVRVEAVAHGGAALAAVRRERPDLVVTDVMMPVLDGIGLVRALRADPTTRAIPVIMLSARAGEESRLEGLDAGADDYLAKPFSARELVARVRVHLSLARTRRQIELERNNFKHLLGSTPVVINFLRGPDLVWDVAHPLAKRAFGGRPLEGLPLLVAVPEHADQPYVDLLRRVYATGEPTSGTEASMLTRQPDGTLKESFWNYAYLPVRDAEGRIDGVMTCDVEVTEQVTARRAVDDARQRLAAALEAANAGTWRTDLVAGSDTRDAGLNRILGLPAVESTQPVADWIARLHPDDRERVLAVVAAAIERRGHYAAEHRIVRADGEVRWVQVRGRVVGDAAGARVMTGAVVDVTDRKRAEAVIVEGEERLRAALEAAAIGTYFWDVRANSVVNDEGVRRLFGFERGEGDDIDDYTARVHEEDRPRWLAALRRSAQEGADFHLEFRVALPDGRVRWLHDQGTMSRDAGGRPAMMSGAVVDITELRQLSEREQEARTRAEEANRAKDEFLAMLGHELRNPLAPIVTALQLMKLREGGKTTREQQIIERQTQHLVRLVDDLLDVSRIARGKVALKREEIDLRDVLSKAVEIASPLFEQRQHRFSLDVDGEALRVSGDAVRLAQVVANLLTNAARYTPVGGSVTLSAARDGDEIVVRVIDDGIGMAAELVPRVFDLFVQGQRSADRAEGGLGLGLTLVKNLVALHGGSVAAASAGPGRGSEFAVRLPALPPEPVAPAASPVPVSVPVAESGARRAARGRRVLVVDDNVDAASTLSEALASAGHEVAVAHDGVQALELVRRFRPHVAVLDIGLPVLDGYELARRMRQLLAPDELPRLIAVTGYGQDRDRQRSGLAGFEQHLVKPVDLGRLLEAIAA